DSPTGDVRKAERPAQTNSHIPASADPQCCSPSQTGWARPGECIISPTWIACSGLNLMLMRAACTEATVVTTVIASMASMVTRRAIIIHRYALLTRMSIVARASPLAQRGIGGTRMIFCSDRGQTSWENSPKYCRDRPGCRRRDPRDLYRLASCRYRIQLRR